MRDMLKEMMKMKGEKKMNPMEKKAKLGVLEEILGMAEDEMGNELKGLKKVTVAAPSEEGLKEGLEKAEEIVEAKDEMSEEESEDEVLSEEEQALLEKLLAKKSKMKM